MKHSLTIVLPVHNGEADLRTNVREVLELAGELTDQFSVLVVDDGSSDDTYEVASELATEFPQVSVRRNAVRRGLGPALDAIRKQLTSDVVVVHDGVTPLDTNQVRRLWKQCTQSSGNTDSAPSGSAVEGLRDLAGISSVHSAMVEAHQRVLGFHVVAASSDGRFERDDHAATVEVWPRGTNKNFQRAEDIGRIPALPRPNFLEVIADFALGE